MTPNEYQKEAMKFAKYKYKDYPFLALGEEAGEVLGKLAKYVRKNDCTLNQALTDARIKYQSPLWDDLVKELGDVLWQVSACCKEIGAPIEDVMQANLDKLSGREERGTIVGQGDKR